MKRVLVTGAGGFVGARILDMWRGQFALCAFPSDTLRTADENAVLRFILKEHPDVIVHTAALSNTQYCQQEPEDSFRANVLLPEWVAKGAEEVGAKLLSCSSDQVYAGVTQRGALAETLPLSPSNVYGQHKLEAEARVLARCPDAVALRLPWMYDLPGYHLPIRGNLPLNILKAAKTGEVLRFSRNDYRGVGYVREVIENLIPAMELPGGVYNFGSEFDGRADGGHAEVGALLARERLGGGAGAQAPHLVGGLDLDVVIVDLQVDRLIGGAFDNDGIPAGLLDGRTDHAAGVGVNNLMIGGIGGKRGDGGAARQGDTGGGQRADGEHDLVLWGERIGAGGHFVVHDLVGQAHTADVAFIRVGGRDRNGFVGQVDAEDLTGPAIGLVGIQF